MFNSKTCDWSQKWNNANVNASVQGILRVKMIIIGIIAIFIGKNNRYLKKNVDNLVIVCNEIINAVDSVSKSIENAVLENITGNVLLNSNDKVVRY